MWNQCRSWSVAFARLQCLFITFTTSSANICQKIYQIFIWSDIKISNNNNMWLVLIIFRLFLTFILWQSENFWHGCKLNSNPLQFSSQQNLHTLLCFIALQQLSNPAQSFTVLHIIACSVLHCCTSSQCTVYKHYGSFQ